jgi:hypothetical protein
MLKISKKIWIKAYFEGKWRIFWNVFFQNWILKLIDYLAYMCWSCPYIWAVFLFPIFYCNHSSEHPKIDFTLIVDTFVDDIKIIMTRQHYGKTRNPKKREIFWWRLHKKKINKILFILQKWPFDDFSSMVRHHLKSTTWPTL